ncbi:MAG: hypothetical protein M1514_00950 [Patescibacteria group bacterium]|nr:hypothetical protein [Patescibacteria group bacterium]
MTLDIIKKITEPIFFVTNDVSRGIGLEKILPNYHLVCLDDHPIVDLLLKDGVSVFCLERKIGRNALRRNSGIILNHPLVLSFIKEKAQGERPNILSFKPQRPLEVVAAREGFNLLANTTALNCFFEDKVSFFEQGQKQLLPLPESEIVSLAFSDFDSLIKKYKAPLVVQFGRGWAGNSTFFINFHEEWEKIKAKFPRIKAKVGKFISGKTIINNAVVLEEGILVSPPALQIKANSILTATDAGTGGREWPAVLSPQQKKEIFSLTQKVGKIMKAKGYKGFFGLDFLAEEETGKIYLSEANARLTASSSFYTQLELEAGVFPFLGYHLLSFLNKKTPVVYPDDLNLMGSEIVARNTESFPLKINNEVAVGNYNWKLNLTSEKYHFNFNKDNFWLMAAAKDRVVNPEIELIKMQTQDSVADEKGNLKENYLQVLLKIKETLLS